MNGANRQKYFVIIFSISIGNHPIFLGTKLNHKFFRMLCLSLDNSGVLTAKEEYYRLNCGSRHFFPSITGCYADEMGV